MGRTTERPPSILRQKREEAALERSSVGSEPTIHRPDPMPWDGWPSGWGLDWGFGASDPAGYMHRVSTVMTAVDLNSRQLASFPIYGLDRSERIVDLPSWAENPEPTVYASWDGFARAAVNSLQLHGEMILYATARDSTGYPARFVALDPQLVNAERDGRGGKVWSIGGEVLDPADLLVICHQTLPGSLRGISPLEWTGRSLVSASALEDYAADIALHGVWSILRHPANLTREQADDLKANFRQARRARPGDPAVIPGGVEFDVLSLSPKDMALLDLRIFDEQRIAAAFGVPPFLIGLPQAQGLTYSNATSLFDFHWRATLRPMAQSIAAAMSAWLLPRGRRFEFNRDEYVRPELEGRARAYQALATIEDETGPAITVDEIRAAERLQPREGSPIARIPGGV